MRDDIDLHIAFVDSMLTQTCPEYFVEASDMDARLEVYRRNFMQGHCRALQKTFAVTAQYLGEAFGSLVVSYVCQHRPKAGQLLATYGDSFPQFLQDPIAAGLARLEWDLQSVMMSKVDENYQMSDSDQVHWQLRSDVRLFQSEYNVRELYRTLKTTGVIPEIRMDQSYYLLRSTGEIPIIISLSLEEYVVLDLLRSPHSIDNLIDKLTFSKEIIVNTLPKVFNANFLKVSDVNSLYDSKMCSSV